MMQSNKNRWCKAPKWVNMDYIYFVYGLSFILLATWTALLAGRNQPLPWRWLALFGLLHGLNEWLDLLALSLGDSPPFRVVRLTVLIISFLPLIEFGRRSLTRQGIKTLGWWVYLPLLVLVALGGGGGISGLNAASRYALALPGGLLAGWVLWQAAGTAEGQPRLGLQLAASCMLLYSVAAGLVTPAAGFFPASWLNHDHFLAVTGMPIQLVRAGCALGIMTGMWLYERRPDLNLKHQHWQYPTLVVALVMLGWLLTTWRGHLTEIEMREQLLRQAVKIAQNLPLDQVATLSFTAADRGAPAFEHLRGLMIAYGRLTRQQSLYSMALRNDALVFGPENLAEEDSLASPPGTIYQHPAPENFELFRNGRPVVFGPWKDEYGVFFSALAPVLDPHSGKVLMAVGLNIDASAWNSRVLASRLAPILITLLLVTIFLAGAGAIRWRNEQPVAKGLSQRLPYNHFETALVGFLGLILTGAATFLVLEAGNRERGVLFDALATTNADNLVREFDKIQASLTALAQFYQTHPQRDLAEFHSFITPLAKATTVQAYAWIPGASVAEAPVEIAARRGKGDDLISVEPLTSDDRTLSFNLNPEWLRRAALESAMRTVLLTAVDTHLTMLVLQPVFAPSLPGRENVNAGANSGSLQGFALAVIRPEILLERILQRSLHDPNQVVVNVLDLMTAEQPALLAVHPQDDQSALAEAITPTHFEQAEFQAIQPLFSFGRAQAIAIRPAPQFYVAYPIYAGWLTGFAGLLLTTVVTLFVGFMRKVVGFLYYRQTTLERLVRARTAALQESEERFRLYFDLGLIGMAITAPGKGWVQFNDRLCEILGYSRAELAAMSWANMTHPDDRAMDVVQMKRILVGEIDGYTLDKRFFRRNGEIVYTLVSVGCVRAPDGSLHQFVGMMQDITERKTLEQKLYWLAHTDSLTHLPNRRHFLEQAELELTRFKRYATPVALLMFDLDHFKQVNDRYGHAAGDAVLCHVAAITRQMLRKTDLSGRIGGEEFAVLLPETDLESARQLAQRLCQIIASSPVDTEAGSITVTLSIGVTLFTPTDATAAVVLSRADRALYQAKHHGRNRVETEGPG
jgi:diguanylate cyclase (GGDEF)-like protein/PAS domain S-box-containing protein